MGILDQVKGIIAQVTDGTLIPGMDLTVPITITQITQGAYDTDAGAHATVPKDYPLRAVKKVITIQILSEARQRYGVQAEVDIGDVELKIDRNQAGCPDAIDTDDTLTIGGVKYDMAKIIDLDIGEEHLMWSVLVRGTR